MRADDPETVADSLAYDIVVAGQGGDPAVDAERIRSDDQLRVVGTEDTRGVGDADRDAGVLVVTIDGSSSVAESTVRMVDDADGFVVAVCNAHPEERVDPSVLERVREAVDVTLLAYRPRPSVDAPSERGDGTNAQPRRSQSTVAVGGALEFIRMVREPGHINLDLADARTVLTDGSLAVVAGGTASVETDGSRRAVQRAFGALPPSIDATQGTDALVSVVGGPDMSIDDAIAAVRAVREAVGDVEEVIWGAITDDALTGRVTVDIVVDDVAYRPPLSAGDPCRRCGAALTAYNFGERTTLACEACGFADLSMSLGERAGRDAEL